MNRFSYAPRLDQKPVNKRPAKILALCGLGFLVLEILLILPIMARGIVAVRTWLYFVTGGMAILLLLAALLVITFQSKKHQMAMRLLSVTILCVAISVGYSAGYMTYSLVKDSDNMGIYDAPGQNYGVYVRRVSEYDDAGNVTSTVYRGFRCFARQAYIFDMFELFDVPADDGFEVTWTDDRTAVLSGSGESVTISFEDMK